MKQPRRTVSIKLEDWMNPFRDIFPVSEIPDRCGGGLQIEPAGFPLQKFWLPVLAACLFASQPAHPGFLKVQGTAIVDSAGREVLLRGFGLGGWLVQEGYEVHVPGTGSPSDIQNKIFGLIGPEAGERFYQAFVGNYVTEPDIAAIASWGCNSVRLPFHYRMFEPEGQAGIRPEHPFAFLDRVIGWCRKNGLYLILDMHCAPGGQNHGNISDSDGTARLWLDVSYRDRTIAIWRAIAQRYADEPWIGGYDLLNEPVLPEGHINAELRALYVKIRNAIRETDKNHILFIEGNWWATDFTSLTPPFDDNLVYAFHKYWSPVTEASIQKYLSLRESAQRPLWLGETGENSNAWFAACVRLVEENRIGWNWWTHKKVETVTSPYSAPIPADCRRVLDYWGGTAAQPLAAAAESALLGLSDNLRIEACAFLPDVVDALVRQPSDRMARPYRPHAVPGLIPAVEYDLGEPGIAYADEVFLNQTGNAGGATWNSGWKFRNDGVDIEESGNAATPHDVGWIATGEWLQYTADVSAGGTYSVLFHVAAPSAGGRVKLRMDGEALSRTLNVPSTGGWKVWRTVQDTGLAIPAGTHVFRVEASTGGYNLLAVEFVLVRPSGIGGSDYESLSEHVRIGRPFPNAFRSSVAIPVVVSSAVRADARIFNLRGELVRTLHAAPATAGTAEWTWDGTTDGGVPATSGVYVCRIEAEGKRKSVKLILRR
jgi:hypothetical protein